MKRLFAGLFAAGCFTSQLSHAAVVPMDSARGVVIFQLQECVQCHRLMGAGGTKAPDLDRVLDRGYTPTLLAGTIWNHAPTMWAMIRNTGMKVGDLDQQGAADLFAAFYSARYFETTGDAGRGKRLFASKKCDTCHGLTSSPNPQAKPVSQWQGLSDPVELVGEMWNHSSTMWGELSQRKIQWPAMTAEDFTDLLVYLRNASPRLAQPTFRITAGEDGEKLLTSKGCVECHNAQHPASGNLTLTGEAAAMWNHASILHTQPPQIGGDEMREMLGSWWAKQFFRGSGDASKGKKVFTAKRCAECHSGAGPGSNLSSLNGNYSAITMVAALWRHGPVMLDEMQKKHIAWPVFKAEEMANLIAWLNQTAKKQGS